jgi:eukaryotic-like serine/threonine-protein kinase
VTRDAFAVDPNQPVKVTVSEDCLSNETMERLLNGARDAVSSAHLAACSECRATLSALMLESEPQVNESRDTLGTTLGGQAPMSHGAFPRQLVPGVRVAERYEVVRFLAAGGMGEVYEVIDHELSERIALKTLHPKRGLNFETIARLKRELQLSRRVTHRNVCRVFDIGQHQEPAGSAVLFLTMELLSGHTLRHRIRSEGPLPLETALDVVTQISKGLSAAHAAGIVHGDLKTSNVMLVNDTNSSKIRAVVTDFGLANDLKQDSSERREWLTGTPIYMAPESAKAGVHSIRSDIYALGVLMYELTTGRWPFEANEAEALLRQKDTQTPADPRIHRPQLPARWAKTINRCLEREPSRRFGSVAEVLQSLRPVKRWPWFVAVCALTFTAVLVGMLLWKVKAQVKTSTEVPSVALLDIVQHSEQTNGEDANGSAIDLLLTELRLDGRLRVSTPEFNEEVFTALEAAQTARGSAEAQRIRTDFSADYVLATRVSFLDQKVNQKAAVRLDATLTHLTLGREVVAYTETGTADQLPQLTAKLASRVRSTLVPPVLRRRSEVPSASAASIKAQALLSEGYDAEQHSRWLAARERYSESLEQDGTNPFAHIGLARSLQALGYELLARESAKKAMAERERLNQDDRLEIEAVTAELNLEVEKAAELYGTLSRLNPDNVSFGAKWANMLSSGRHVKEAGAALAGLRALPVPLKDDLRIDLAEANHLSIRFEYAQAEQAARTAYEKAKVSENTTVMGEAKRFQAAMLMAQNRDREAIEVAKQAVELLERAEGQPGASSAWGTLGKTFGKVGDWPNATAAFRKEYDIAQSRGGVSDSLSALHNLAVIADWSNDLPLARQRFESAAQSSESAGDSLSAGQAWLNAARVSFRLGDKTRSQQLAERAISIFEQTAQYTLLSRAHATLASSLSLDSPRESLPFFGQAINAARKAKDLDVVAQLTCAEALMRRELGEGAASTEAVNLALSQAVEPTSKATCLVVKAQLALDNNALAEGRQIHQEIIQRLVTVKSAPRGVTVESQTNLAELSWLAGNHQEALRQLDAIELTPKALPVSVGNYFSLRAQVLLSLHKTKQAQDALDLAKPAALNNGKLHALRFCVLKGKLDGVKGKRSARNDLLSCEDSAKRLGLLPLELEAQMERAFIERRFNRAASKRLFDSTRTRAQAAGLLSLVRRIDAMR